MKNMIILLVLTTALSCQDGTGNSDNSNSDDSTDFDIRGAHSMIKQVGNDGTKDTLLKKEQLKIFSDKFMMYASPRATDSFGEYGIAIYRQNRDTVKEFIFYTSSEGEVRDTALLFITKLPNGYRQVINYQDTSGTFRLTEDYDRVGKEPKSPLDGAWTQQRDILIGKNGDTSRNIKKTQFKIYESGYFIWANPIKDPSSNNFVSTYGYGTFKMLNDKKSQETNINSTFYSSLVGRPVDIDIEMNGPDKYTQTIVGTNGEKSVEVYERLK
jgi:hypothetical protein